MTRPLGVILAGGQAERMGGGDKALLPLGDGTLLDHVVARLSPQVSGLVLNANGQPARFSDTGLPVVADSVTDAGAGFAGPLAGVLAGMDHAAATGADHIVTAAADTPFFPVDLVVRLSAVLTPERPIAMAATPDPKRGLARHPTFALWPVWLRELLRAALKGGTRKVVAFSDPLGTASAAFPDEAAFFNVNRPEDLVRASEMLEARR